MPAQRDFYDSAYTSFSERVLSAVRLETFGVDIGQNSWVTTDEYDRLLPSLDLSAGRHALEVASGSGGPARYVARATGCRITGIDANTSAVSAASQMAIDAGDSANVRFVVADANDALPFDEGAFDAILCIDAMNHLPDRLAVLKEWHRVLRTGRRAMFTDPVVVTGPVTSEELALRSSIGAFLFVPPGVNEKLIDQAGFRLVRQDDATPNAAMIAERWHQSRSAHEADLIRIEGQPRFEQSQRFFEVVHRLSAQRRLSRIAYVIEKR